MQGETAFTANGLSIEERRARLAKLVEDGEVTPEHAALIEFRDPPAAVRERARQLSVGLKERMEKLLRDRGLQSDRESHAS